MARTNDSGWALRAMAIGSLALSIGLADLRPSLAACGGYCEARQARALCHRAITIEGVKGVQRDIEFEKCATDPMKYLQIEDVVDDADISFY